MSVWATEGPGKYGTFWVMNEDWQLFLEICGAHGFTFRVRHTHKELEDLIHVVSMLTSAYLTFQKELKRRKI